MGEDMLSELRQKIRKLAVPSLSVFNLEPATLLASVPFLSNAASEDLKVLSARLRAKTVSADSDIVSQGDKGNTMYLIGRGVVRVYRQAQDHSQRQRIQTLIAGDYFGEFAFLTREPRNVTCKSVTVCSLYELTRQDFDVVLAERPRLRETV